MSDNWLDDIKDLHTRIDPMISHFDDNKTITDTLRNKFRSILNEFVRLEGNMANVRATAYGNNVLKETIDNTWDFLHQKMDILKELMVEQQGGSYRKGRKSRKSRKGSNFTKSNARTEPS